MGFIRKYFLAYLYSYLFYPLIKTVYCKFHIMSSLETIRYLQEKNASIVRFGDGEFNLLAGKKGPSYQNSPLPQLSARLKEAISFRNKNFIVAIPRVLHPNHLTKEKTTKEAFLFWRTYICQQHSFFKTLLDYKYQYGDAQISRPYMDFKDRESCSEIFTQIKKLWLNRNVVIIEGELTRFGLGNDLLMDAKSVKRIIAPSQNAFCKYDDILQMATTFPTSTLFILALGPTAKPLALDLFKKSYQVLDLGHLDIEYEWYRRGASKKISIPNKYVNEAENRYEQNPNSQNLDEYRKQIIFKIS